MSIGIFEFIEMILIFPKVSIILISIILIYRKKDVNRIKELRAKKNMKQGELAAYLGVAQSTLSGWESEKYQIDNENLFKLADYFGVSVGYLLGKEEKSEIKDSSNDTIDVQEKLQELLSQLETKDSLMFSGVALSDDSKELLAAALERILRLTKTVNKDDIE